MLDSSSFNVRMSDVSLAGFQSSPIETVGSNFPRNIPFGFVIVPCMGSDFNPFNGSSRLKQFENGVVRELSVVTAPSPGLQKDNATPFKTYNLYNDNGSERVGGGEDKDIHNFGYRFEPSDFEESFYRSGQIGSSPTVVSSNGLSYLVKDILDYLKDEYDPGEVLWYDIYSRMPLSRLGELSYDSSEDYIKKLVNGYRNGIKIKDAEKNSDNPPQALSEDSKTIVKLSDRREFYPLPR